MGLVVDDWPHFLCKRNGGSPEGTAMMVCYKLSFYFEIPYARCKLCEILIM